jgi:hypothetical protein
MGRNILHALRQGLDQKNGDANRRAKLDRAILPFIYANFPLFPELADCLDQRGYGTPVMIGDRLFLKIDSLNYRNTRAVRRVKAPSPPRTALKSEALPTPQQSTEEFVCVPQVKNEPNEGGSMGLFDVFSSAS